MFTFEDIQALHRGACLLIHHFLMNCTNQMNPIILKVNIFQVDQSNIYLLTRCDDSLYKITHHKYYHQGNKLLRNIIFTFTFALPFLFGTF